MPTLRATGVAGIAWVRSDWTVMGVVPIAKR